MRPDLVENAFKIGAADLRACFGENGIWEKKGKHTAFDARGAFFGGLGAMAIRDTAPVQLTLDFFLNRQRADGMLPVRIQANGTPSYSVITGESLDHHGIFFALLAEWLLATGQWEFAAKRSKKLVAALEFLEQHDLDKDGLVEENAFSGWSNSVLKWGKVMYSNASVHLAYREAARVFEALGQAMLADKYRTLARQSREMINRVFWFGNHYMDWLDFGEQDFFSSDGNIAAIAWDIADAEQAQRIQNTIRQHRLDHVPIVTNHPAYPFWRIPLVLLPFEEYHLHNGFAWSWLGSLNAIALMRMNQAREARRLLRVMSELVVRDGFVAPIWTKKGLPVRMLFARAEANAWSAGLFVAAVKTVYGE